MVAVKKRSSTPQADAREIEKVVAALRKQHGAKTLRKGSEAIQPYRIPSGIFEFDRATLGGIPYGRTSLVHGPKHSGKSSISSRLIMGAQQTIEDGTAVLIDAEGTHDAVWSDKIGVDNDSLLLVQPDGGEQAVDMIVALTYTKEVSLIVVDSVGALMPLKEQESDADQALVGVHAKLVTSMMRKISAAHITERKRGHYVTLLLINQQRSKIGGWAPPGQEALGTPGGKALGHFTSLEWRMKNKENMKDGVLTYNDHAFHIEKNKMNGGQRTGEFRLLRRDEPDIALTEAEVDDAPIMISRAKDLGWYTGSGKSGFTLSFGDVPSMHAPNVDTMILQLYQDREYLWQLRCHLIAAHAASLGMPANFVEYLRVGTLYE